MVWLKDNRVMVWKLCWWMLWMSINRRNLQRNVKQKIDWKNHKKISLTFKFFCNISPNTATWGFPEDIWRVVKKVFSRHLVCLRVSLRIHWRPWRAKVLFFILLYQRNMQFIKVFRVFSDTADIHTLKPKHGWRLPRKVLQGWDADLQALQIFVLYAKHIYKSNVSHIYSWRNIWTCKIIQGDSSSHVSCFLSPQRSRKLGCVRKHSDMRESYFVTSGWCMYVNKMGNVVFR